MSGVRVATARLRVDGVEDAREGDEVDRRRHQRDEEVERDARERGDVLADPLVRVVEVAVDLDLVVRLVGVVLARELGRHPLAPVEREALALELVEHGERRRHRQPHREVRRLLEEQRLVLGRQRAVKVAADEREDHRDPRVDEHQQQHQPKVELRAVGLLKVRHRQPPEQPHALLQRRVRDRRGGSGAVLLKKDGAVPRHSGGDARRSCSQICVPRRKRHSRWATCDREAVRGPQEEHQRQRYRRGRHRSLSTDDAARVCGRAQRSTTGCCSSSSRRRACRAQFLR